MRYVNCIVVLCVLFFFIPIAVLAGSLDDPAAPTSADSAMYTLENIYNRLNSNTQATKRSGSFTEPSAAPGSTGYTLDQVYEKAIPTQVEKTGQTTSYATGDDGDLEKGIAWPSPRFTDNGNGTVTDNLTGLIWLKNANCTDTVGGVDKSGGTLTWANALTWSNNLANGDCGLTDSSSAGDWRLPNIRELSSLTDFSQSVPALPSDHPFTGVQTSNSEYWSSTTAKYTNDNAWYVYMFNGRLGDVAKTFPHYVWPVRRGQ